MPWLLRAYALPSVFYRDRANLPKNPGIYFIVRKGAIIYIGKAGMGLRARWRNHHEKGLKPSDRILYAKVRKYRCGHEEAKAIDEYFRRHGHLPARNQNKPKKVWWITLLDDSIAAIILFLGVLLWFNGPNLPALAARACPLIKVACVERTIRRPPHPHILEYETPDRDQPFEAKL